MGDTSERSKPPGLPPRCPCGFWGSSKTMNLCSKCFADIQKKPPDEDCPSKGSSSETTTATITTIANSGTTTAINTTTNKTPSISSSVSPSLSLPTATELPAAEEPSPLFAASKEVSGVSSTVTAQSTMCMPTKRPRESASASESEATPEKRPRAEAKEEEEEDDGGEEQAGSTPKQKNRRRCYSCQSKLELVQQELGSCRCGYVFCMLHRLPEQHDCLFDHLGRGREEAVLKMVKLDRKVGRSCQRIGEECS
ncbi:AN1-type zinc finger protein 3-like [Phyllopteryx taeniolatus]|uniref:AN1-type zinc finger protein 3-like n=1 Tax=Phyllopteryx taeniolatus TaxID=161469 RepID=UPI002AD40693|nr:AN1-type zinc finger protein 3-like [Phyllopteryx taeniolatus]